MPTNGQRKAFQARFEDDSQFNEHSTILAVLRSCQTLRSSGPRDMLFAVLNIVPLVLQPIGERLGHFHVVSAVVYN
jgi:hypothetical protein